MPRPSKRGGARQGTPGTNYNNRSDLRAVKTLPITTAPGQQYGAATAQANAQRAMPMGVPLVSGQAPQGGPSVPAGPLPGSLPGILDPTQRPDEHFMSGVNTGGGSGSDALVNTLPPNPAANALGLLNSLGDNVSPAVWALREELRIQAQNQARQ